jgi:hypothetical protein
MGAERRASSAAGLHDIQDLAVARRLATVEQQGRPCANHTPGRSMAWTCRCGSVELPEFPHAATTVPWSTRSPTATRNEYR